VDIAPDPGIEAFRAEVAEFLDTAPTPAIREAGRKTTSVFAPFEQVMAWHKILHRRGWAAPSWPVEHGGTGWSVEQQYVFAEEYQRRGLPPLLPNGLRMVGPLLMDLGTDEQKAEHLPGILSGDDYWTQGYSEPGAGSDLASLSCAAVPDGDDYVITGSKIWTTNAHHANRMFMLVRTSREGHKQQGITFLLLDRVDLPGMAIRPIVGLDGAPEQCEVFFDGVRVPQSGRVGAEGDGWTVAKHLLVHERGGTAANSPALRERVRVIRRAATATPSAFGGTLAEDPVFRRDLGELEAEVASYEHFEKLAISGHPVVRDPAYASLSKVISSELTQRVSVLMTRVVGLDALPDQREALLIGSDVPAIGDDLALIAMPYYLNSRAASIYAGTNEVQRDLIARTLSSVEKA
jgi:alkylation response protein AidB-like acyl-CoA dehydrogenase